MYNVNNKSQKFLKSLIGLSYLKNFALEILFSLRVWICFNFKRRQEIYNVMILISNFYKISLLLLSRTTGDKNFWCHEAEKILYCQNEMNNNINLRKSLKYD